MLGRKVFFDRGYYVLYPNFFTVLVAGSARCRKSTAIGIGMSLLKSLDSIRVLSGKTSPERFLGDALFAGPKDEDVPPILIHADELAVFLTKDSQGDKLIDILTKLFDCPDKFEYKTWNHGIITLRDVFIAIIAGTTPEGAAKCITDYAFGGGWASRLILVHQADTNKRNALPELSNDEILLREELVAGLLRIGRQRGPFELTPAGKAFYIDWYGKITFPEDKRMEGYYGRKHDHVLRLAMILSAAQLEHPRVDEDHLEAAVTALDRIELEMPCALAQVGTTDVRIHIERITRQMQKYKRIAHSDLLKKNWHYLHGPEFRDIIDMMITAGYITRDPKKTYFYVWNGPMPNEPQEEQS